MTRTLPPRPHPDHLRAQARDLLAAWRAADADALARAAPLRLPGPPKLAQAQLVLAREHGFASWTQLMREVEGRQAAQWDDGAFTDRVLQLALGRGWHAPQPVRALALAQTRPADRHPLAVRLVLGEAEAAALNPAAALPPLGVPPLVLVAFSGLARLPERHDRLLATLQALLARGADPNAALPDRSAEGGHRLPALYGAVARARSLPMVQALLAAGAEPNDGESLYHATENADPGFVAALVATGARWAGTNAFGRLLDREDPAAVEQALALGADVHERGLPDGRTPLAHAIVRGRSAAVVQRLLAAGADPAARDDTGLDARAHARRLGDPAVLAALGDAASVDASEALLAACAAGDETAARRLLTADPGALARLDPPALRLLPDQAQRGRFAAVRLMLALGWPVAARGDWDASALNQAAFRGDAAMVRLLLDHGARWDEPNGFGGDALGSCLHAAANEPLPGGDYAAVYALLRAAGAPPPEDPGELPEALQAVEAGGL